MSYFRSFFLTLSFATSVISSLSAADRPNILFAFADDWGRYASAYREVDGTGTANDLIETPHFDRVAREGVLFKNAFVTAPSCTPCRSSIVSGQYFFRTGQGAILQGAIWDETIPVFPLMLRDSGYHIGKVYKVWSPGDIKDAPFGAQQYGFELKGPDVNTFSQSVTRMVAKGVTVAAAKEEMLSKVEREFAGFLDAQPGDAPFLFWFGPTNVHRKWTRGSGKALWDLEPDGLKGKLPAFLPDVPEIREDFADYLGEAMAFDAALGVLLGELEKRGELENTLVVVSGDHGAPGFPRGKCNLYDFGQAVALAACWGDGKIPKGRVVDDFVNLMDLAPTFLEAGEVAIPEVMTGKSLLNVFTSAESGLVDETRTRVVTGRERHVAGARTGNKPYPQRAIRTKDHLYIYNFEPDRWPMGTPGAAAEDELPSTDVLSNDTFICFADLDASPTKAWMVENRENPKFAKSYQLGFAKRPQVELYVLSDDPDQMNNRAGDETLAEIQKSLHDALFEELTNANDPRVVQDPVPFEAAPFTEPYGKRRKK
ncbi:MAG: sulfatase [Verrucomicrobiales bacterium]|nr:sulfatase [Verrucomicrobiales bacterium]